MGIREADWPSTPEAVAVWPARVDAIALLELTPQKDSDFKSVPGLRVESRAEDRMHE